MSYDAGERATLTFVRASLSIAGTAVVVASVLKSGFEPTTKLLLFGALALWWASLMTLAHGIAAIIQALERGNVNTHAMLTSLELSRLGLDKERFAIDSIESADASPQAKLARGLTGEAVVLLGIGVVASALLPALATWILLANWAQVIALVP